MQVSEVFERAAALVEQGWMQGDCGGIGVPKVQEENGVCASIAILKVCNATSAWTRRDIPDYCRAAHAVLMRAIGAEAAHINAGTWALIYRWNDNPKRSKDEVVAMLRACAATEKAREAAGMPAKAPKLAEAPLAQWLMCDIGDPMQIVEAKSKLSTFSGWIAEKKKAGHSIPLQQPPQYAGMPQSAFDKFLGW